MENKTKRVELSRADIIKCDAHLKEHLHPIEGTKLWRYDEGWDDLHIATLVGGTATAHKVSSLRRELYGNTLAPRVTREGNAELEARIIASLDQRLGSLELQQRVATLERQLLETNDVLSRLITGLKLNHVGDFRNLLHGIQPPKAAGNGSTSISTPHPAKAM